MSAEAGGPVSSIVYPDGSFDRGISLRDYFAAASLPGVLAHGSVIADVARKTGTLPPVVAATVAYGIADAMLKASKEVRS